MDKLLRVSKLNDINELYHGIGNERLDPEVISCKGGEVVHHVWRLHSIATAELE
jgi:hypothetical protein